MHSFETLITFAKQRGFVFISSEIYGGFGGVYDYGPLGVLLANNLKKIWWREMVQERMDIVGIDSGIIMNPKVWEASGHTENFTDPMTVCKSTGKQFRADHLLEDIGVNADERMSKEEFVNIFEKHQSKLNPDGCSAEDLTQPTFKNLLVSSDMGKVEMDSNGPYLRGETCQGIYVNFKNVLNSMHMKLPFGIAQIGKAFRNEISPRQFLFRTREFEQMEMQYFTHQENADADYKEFLTQRLNSLIKLGIRKENLRVTAHERLVFYAKSAQDIEYKYTFGWKELEGIHNRGDYDLSQHSKHSGEKLTYFDQNLQKHITPYVIETSIGVGRLFLAILNDAYAVEQLPDGSERTVLRLRKDIAPMTVAILPLLRKDAMTEKAREIFSLLSKHYYSYYDDTGTIGKRYRRADEIGTPYAVTIDYDTVGDDSVTIRNRDSMKQDRVSLQDIHSYIESDIKKEQDV